MRLLLAALTLLATSLTAYAQQQPLVAVPITEPILVAESVVAIDATQGKVLYEKNSEEKRPVASTQKLLTALIISQAGNLDEKIPVKSTDGQVQPRNLWITQGSSYPRRKLLEMMLVRSFNDVTKCLARDHAGSQAEFAKIMQQKAEALGMKDSVFLNAHGLPQEGQYSTARDMMILTIAAWSDPTIREMVGIKDTTFTYTGAKTIPVENSNELLKKYPECIGIKTGYTKAAGRCLIAAAQRGEKTVLAVILGSTMDDLWNDSELLLRWALDQ